MALMENSELVRSIKTVKYTQAQKRKEKKKAGNHLQQGTDVQISINYLHKNL